MTVKELIEAFEDYGDDLIVRVGCADAGALRLLRALSQDEGAVAGIEYMEPAASDAKPYVVIRIS